MKKQKDQLKNMKLPEAYLIELRKLKISEYEPDYIVIKRLIDSQNLKKEQVMVKSKILPSSHDNNLKEVQK